VCTIFEAEQEVLLLSRILDDFNEIKIEEENDPTVFNDKPDFQRPCADCVVADTKNICERDYEPSRETETLDFPIVFIVKLEKQIKGWGR
jgi:hypothetical protein